MYVAVKGGEAAIQNAHRLLADRRRGARDVPALTLEQIAGQLATEGGPYKIKAMFLYADALFVQAQYARAKVIYQKLRTELHGEQRAIAQKKIVACNKELNLPENSGID